MTENELKTLVRIETVVEHTHADVVGMRRELRVVEQDVLEIKARFRAVAYAAGVLSALAAVVGIVVALSGCVAPVHVPARSVEVPVDTVVALVSESGDAFCAGTHVDGGILTAAHCVPASYEGPVFACHPGAFVADPVGGHFDTAHCAPTTAVRVDRGADLALMTDALGGPHAALGPPPRQGDPVALVGMPVGTPFVVTRGHVASDLCIDRAPCHTVVDINAGPGNSGGPMFDAEGRLVGVLVQGVGSPFTGYPIHLTVPVATVTQFLRSR